MVSSIGSSFGASSSPAADTNSATKTNSLRQQDFLRLMVAQMQNQDPMNPQTNGDFLAQMAQFSTNDSIASMQSSIAQLASTLQSNQALQASALVGRSVVVDGNKLALGNEGGAKASFNMTAGLNELNASIYSPAGELVKTIPLGQPNPGLTEIPWDGTDGNNQRVAAGTYTVKVTGLDHGKETVVPTMVTANVDSVSLGQNGEGLKLNVAGIGSIALSDVKQISV